LSVDDRRQGDCNPTLDLDSEQSDAAGSRSVLRMWR
jgi:hypothetical protein